MGPTLARMARRAAPGADRLRGRPLQRPGTRRRGLREHGVETIRADLLERDAARRLPRVPNVVFMAGQSSAASAPPPDVGDERARSPRSSRRRSRTAGSSPSRPAASTRSCPIDSGGSTEDSELDAAGRVRHELRRPGARDPLALGAARHARAADPPRTTRSTCATACCTTSRARCATGEPIDVTMGHVNVIWQGDASAMALRCLARTHDADGAPERDRPGDRSPSAGSPVSSASASASGRSSSVRRRRRPGSRTRAGRSRLFGYPKVTLLETMIDWVADWVAARHAEPREADPLRGPRWQLLRTTAAVDLPVVPMREARHPRRARARRGRRAGTRRPTTGR